jgi:phytoene synthase
VRDRDLVRLHWPESRRAAFDIALALDDRLAEIALGSAQPALAAIKLAWWRDQLAALDTQPPPPEPMLGRVVSDLMVAGVGGADCARLAEAWGEVVTEEPDPAPRGHALFALLGRLIGQAEVPGGEAFSRADLARRSGDAEWLRKADAVIAPRPVRPITLLDALGRRDAARFWPPEPEATPGRSWTLIRHRLTGR